MTHSLRLAALLCLLCAPATAQEVDCANAMAQQELNICAEQDWQKADIALNITYKEVMAEMKAMDEGLPEELQGAEAALREAQRAWVAFRDANCEAAGFEMRGGSAEALLVYGCLRRMTVDRTQELAELNQF
ncbi:lysozyme inhibitor LprI family protein [Tabrizicola sp.]|uniref:lysozyme inhibitor LprI family protein n=1 Tax=Tabrizicola sp. TaxID=2005166 RepID=UPI00286AB8B3|nr:lysozyme inhibitor LprI family protein [Tabrizicola sp.]